MNILEWLVVFAAVGALLIVLVPHAIRHYWYRANRRGFVDWVTYRQGGRGYPICSSRFGYFRSAYMLGQRQAQHSQIIKSYDEIDQWIKENAL